MGNEWRCASNSIFLPFYLWLLKLVRNAQNFISVHIYTQLVQDIGPYPKIQKTDPVSKLKIYPQHQAIQPPSPQFSFSQHLP